MPGTVLDTDLQKRLHSTRVQILALLCFTAGMSRGNLSSL